MFGTATHPKCACLDPRLCFIGRFLIATGRFREHGSRSLFATDVSQPFVVRHCPGTNRRSSFLFSDLINVFDVFLPQLLLYPNPTDPLNGEAAALMIREPEKYKAKIAEYVTKYAADSDEKPDEDESDSAGEMSDHSEDEADAMDP